MRRDLSLDERDNLSVLIANNILSVDIWEKSYFHIYLPIISQNEVNTESVLHLLRGKNKQIVVSKSDFASRQMTHFILDDDTVLRKNEYGIPEPENGQQIVPIVIDVVFVPLLAFDLQGHRIGYGKGFYDKFLSSCRPDVIKIGLTFFDPEDTFSDVHPGDVKIDFCVTPKKVYKF